MRLFTAKQLSDFIQESVSQDTAVEVEKVVWGWLAPKLGVTERPAVVSDQLYGWAIELGAIAVENPTGLAAYQLGQERWQYSAERRVEILDEAEASTPGAAAGGPVGRFPAARPYPDPVERW